MGLKDRDSYLIEQHIRGLLTPKEELEFTRRSSDTQFSAEVNFQNDLRDAVTTVERERLKTRLKGLDIPAKSNIKNIRLKKILVAASIALLAVLAYATLFNKGHINTSDLYAEYFESPPNIVAPLLKSESDENSEYNSAFQMYESGQYAKAEQAFELLEEDGHIQFYQSMCEINLEKWDEAKTRLISIRTAGGLYSSNAQWYIALIDLQAGNIESARQILIEIIAREGHPYKANAEKLIVKLGAI